MEDIRNLNCVVGTHALTGLGETPFDLPELPDNVVTTKGIDGVSRMVVNPKSQILEVVVRLRADSPSVLIMKGFEKSHALVPFDFSWPDFGFKIFALECDVRETNGVTIEEKTPTIEFTCRLTNFIEIKGL